MKIAFSRYLYFLIPEINSFLLIEKEKKERETEKELIGSLSSLHFQLNSFRVILHLGGWVKIKYLHLIR